MDSAIAYEQHANDFLDARDRSSTGSEVVRDWADGLVKQAEVLELACGGGYPVTTELSKSGLALWAIDSSETLLSTFHSRFPEIPTRCERIQESIFFDKQFDAIIAIGLVFLLSESDQEMLIKKVSGILSENGRFLFSAPTEIGKWQDLTTGIESHSLGLERYQQLLMQNGFDTIDRVVDESGNNYYDAKGLTGRDY